MKHFTVGLVAAITLGMGLASAAPPVPTPKAGLAKVNPASTPNPVSKNVNARMMEQIQQIKKDLHAGKITEAQAKALRDQVKAIRKQALDDMKANGKKLLTPAQESELNAALDANAKSL